MPSRQDILDSARRMLGTPFHHQGRLPGVGIDCIGLIVCVGQEVFGSFHDSRSYSREPRPDILLPELDKAFERITMAEARRADVLVFSLGKRAHHPGHVGILGDRIQNGVKSQTLIHTHAGLNRGVSEVSFTKAWGSRILFAYRYPGLED